MALCMKIPTPYMVDATYSCIQTVQVYYANACLDVTLLCFLDEGAHKNKAAPLTTWAYRFTFEEVGADDPTRKQIYEACKRLPFWADANDC